MPRAWVFAVEDKFMINTEHFFARHPVFTAGEFAAFHRQAGSGHAGSRQSALAHHESRGRIVRVRRRLYASVAPRVAPRDGGGGSVSRRVADGSRRGPRVPHRPGVPRIRAHVFSTDQYLTATAARPASFRSMRFQPVRMPRSLCEHGEERFGVRVEDRLGLDVPVNEMERTCVDVLDRIDLGGGLEAVWRSIDSVPTLDVDQVVAYAIRLGTATTVAKVGFFLESRAERFGVRPGHLDSLRRDRPRSPQYVHRGSASPQRFLSPWNLVVPVELAERTWEDIA